MPLELALFQRLAYTARGSRWHLCTVSDFRLHVIFRAALNSSQRSVGVSWHMPSGRNTESTWFGPVLWLRWWRWGKLSTTWPAMCDLKWPFNWGLWTEELSVALCHEIRSSKLIWRNVLGQRRNFNSRAVLWYFIFMLIISFPVWKNTLVPCSSSMDDALYL